MVRGWKPNTSRRRGSPSLRPSTWRSTHRRPLSSRRASRISASDSPSFTGAPGAAYQERMPAASGASAVTIAASLPATAMASNPQTAAVADEAAIVRARCAPWHANASSGVRHGRNPATAHRIWADDTAGAATEFLYAVPGPRRLYGQRSPAPCPGHLRVPGDAARPGRSIRVQQREHLRADHGERPVEGRLHCPATLNTREPKRDGAADHDRRLQAGVGWSHHGRDAVLRVRTQ